MSVLLLILKTLALVALAILGLLLAVVLLFLFVPVRYRIQGSFAQKKPQGQAKVTWLLHFLSFRIQYGEQGLDQAFRVLGIRLWPRKKKKKQTREEEDGLEQELTPQEQALYEEMGAQRQQPAGEPESSGPEAGAPEKSERAPEPTRADAAPEPTRADAASEPEPSGPETGTPDTETVPEGKPFWMKISGFFKKLYQKIKFSFLTFCDKLKETGKKIETGRAWLEDEANQDSLRRIARQAKKVVRHLLPRKGHGQVTFGFEDPYTTGQILTWISPFYPLYSQVIEVRPVFGEAVIQAEGDLRGRIRLFSVLWPVFLIFIHKHTRRMIRKLIR